MALMQLFASCGFLASQTPSSLPCCGHYQTPSSSGLFVPWPIFLRNNSICFLPLPETRRCLPLCEVRLPASAARDSSQGSPRQRSGCVRVSGTSVNQAVTKSLPAPKLGSGGLLPKTLLPPTALPWWRATLIAVQICALEAPGFC